MHCLAGLLVGLEEIWCSYTAPTYFLPCTYAMLTPAIFLCCSAISYAHFHVRLATRKRKEKRRGGKVPPSGR
ncbi:hypothetical protein BX600DRAFT_475867 [Xylariales sp. PMI_506]|nr:hypothetical protein BX600DRAFT_475867 [Xylariales sp. PMI_506]